MHTGTDYDTHLAAYTGASVDALTPVGANDNGCGVRSVLTFIASAGTTYHVAVDGSGAATGHFELLYSRNRPYLPRPSSHPR